MRLTQANILALVFISFFTLSVSAKYFNFVITRNYIVDTHIACEPTEESCFIEVCEEGDECSQEPYKHIEKNAQFIEYCNPYNSETTCPELTCAPGEADCLTYACTPELESDYEICVQSQL